MKEGFIEHAGRACRTNWLDCGNRAEITEGEKNWTFLLYLESLTIQTMPHTLKRNGGNVSHQYACCYVIF